jgi:hypothetical protein
VVNGGRRLGQAKSPDVVQHLWLPRYERVSGNSPATDPVQELSWFVRSNCTLLAELRQR